MDYSNCCGKVVVWIRSSVESSTVGIGIGINYE